MLSLKLEVLLHLGCCLGVFFKFSWLHGETAASWSWYRSSEVFGPQQEGIDYYSGIENVAIFNAVIYPPPGCHCHVELEALGSPRGCGTYVTHGPRRVMGRALKRQARDDRWA